MSDMHPDSLHGKPGVSLTGTNQGRTNVPMRGPGEVYEPSGPRGKARPEMGVPVKLAMGQESEEGGYNKR